MSNIFPNKNVHNLSYNEDAYSHKKKKFSVREILFHTYSTMKHKLQVSCDLS